MVDIYTAFQLLTRWPIPKTPTSGDTQRAVWAYPVVGLALGVAAYGIAQAALALGLTPSVISLLLVVCLILWTGAMHEDGLADCADGFWGGWTREQRLEIMRDSRIGTYGVCALILLLLLRWHTLTLLLTQHSLALIGVLAFSRCVLPVVMVSLSHARKDGLAVTQGQPKAIPVLIALVIGTASLILCAPTLSLGGIMLAVCTIVTLGIMLLAKVKIGGVTGDVLGATVLLIEGVCLTILSGFQ